MCQRLSDPHPLQTSQGVSGRELKLACQILIKFDQILTKFDQILTIYVKNHQIHVKQIQECHFLKIKNPTSKIIHNLDAEQNIDTSRFWTRKPKFYNIHIYHVHVLELLNLDFSLIN